MQYPDRFADLPEYAFPRLRRLLQDTPQGGELLSMSIGEPRHPIPEFVPEVLAQNAHLYAKYPPNDGAPELLEAISGWISRRYGVTKQADEILPLNGTREGLFAACMALCPERKNGERPTVLLPNPFYQCYAVAALAAGAEPVFVPATADSAFLPDFHTVPEALLKRAAIIYMCSPSNPQGAVADAPWWGRLMDLAQAHDIRIFADECYSEIYRDTPPAGAIEVAHARGVDPERMVIFHSLSKRSNLPGLRSGFAAGGRGAIAQMRQLRNYAGAPLPLPAQIAAAATWADEAHVIQNRALYQEKFALSDRMLGNCPGYHAPEAGFFLWLKVADDEAATKQLWADHGIRVLPGRYLARDTDAALGGGNPGAGYIRAALVAPKDEITRGLSAIADLLNTQSEAQP